MNIQIISQSADGRRAQIVAHESDALGRKSSRTRHVVKRGSQWEYAPPRGEATQTQSRSASSGEPTVVESYEVGT